LIFVNFRLIEFIGSGFLLTFPRASGEFNPHAYGPHMVAVGQYSDFRTDRRRVQCLFHYCERVSVARKKLKPKED